MIEISFEQREYLSTKDVMVQMVRGMLRYQFENRELTRFFYRELSLDTTLIREVMTVYFSKERYYIEQIIRQGQIKQEFQKVSFTMFMTQLKGMINMRFISTIYIRSTAFFPSETFFIEMYTKEIEQWMEQALCKANMYHEWPRAVHM